MSSVAIPLTTHVEPFAALAERFVEDPLGHRLDQAGALGLGDETIGVEESVGGMLPADERFGSRDPHRIHRRLGLVVQYELVARHRVAEVPEQGQMVRGIGVQPARVHGHPGPCALRDVHGDVGSLEQQIRAPPVVRPHGDPATGLDPEVQPVDVEGLFERGHDPPGDSLGVLGRPHVGEEEAEFVSAEAGQGVALAEDAAHTGADFGEQQVAVTVAHRVVDVLEVIEVEQQDRAGASIGFGLLEGLRRALVEVRLVRESGEGVVQRLVGEEGLRLLPLLADRARHPDGEGEHHRTEHAERGRLAAGEEGRSQSEPEQALRDRDVGEAEDHQRSPERVPHDCISANTMKT